MKNFTFYFLTIFAFCTIAIGSVDAQVFFTEDFESTPSGPLLPTGFTIKTLSTDGGYAIGTPAEGSSTWWGIPAAGGQLAYTNDDACNCDKSDDKLVLPTQDLSTYGNVTLTSSLFNDGAYGDTADIEVSTDNGLTWTSVYNIPANGAFQTITVDLSAYAGMANIQIAFRYNDAGGWAGGFAVDDVTLAEVLCGAPTVLATSNITDVAADLTWTDGAGCGSNHTVTISPAIAGSPFSVACGTETLSLTGLAGSTTYTATIANDCGTLPSADITFTTGVSCAYTSISGSTITTGSPVDDNIVVTGTGGSGDVILDLDVAVYATHTFLADLDISLTSPTGTVVELMFDQCGGNDNMEITFDDEGVALACATPTVGTFTVVNVTGATLADFDGETFDGTWTLNVTDDAGGDDGVLTQWCLLPTLGAPCFAPTATAAANVTSADADLSWTDGAGCGTNFIVTVSPAITGSPFSVACGTEALSLTGLLAPTTTYTVTVANDCGAMPSETIMFTTTALCDVPTTVAATNVLGTSADVTWTDGVGCGTNHTVTVSPAIAGSPFSVACGTETISLTGLTGSTAYTVTVANDCGTLPSTDVSFTTVVDCAYTSAPGSTITTGSPVDDNIVVTGTGGSGDVILDLDVAVYLTHTYLSDLTVTLTSPTGTVVELIGGTCGANNDMEITFDDDGVAIVCAEPTIGVFMVSGTASLADYNGETFDGTWSLNVTDGFTGDDGVLTQWCLLPTLGAPCFAPTATMVEDVAAVDADLSWVDGAGCGTNFVVTVSPAITGSPFSVTCGTEALSFTGLLTPETTYTVTVANDCAAMPSETIMFTTTALCDVPTSVAASNLTTNSADITWTDGVGCTTGHIVTVDPAIPGSPFSVACGTETLSLSGLATATTYTVTIANDCGATTPSDVVTFSTLIAGDNCADAIPITVNDGSVCGGTFPFNNTGATVEAGEAAGSCWIDTGGATATVSMWFSFTVTKCSVVTISTDHAGSGNDDTQIAVYDGCGGAEIACDEDGGTDVNFNSVATVAVTAGTYLIQVDGWNGTTGDFCLTVDSAPCCGADFAHLPTASGTTTAANYCEDGAWTYYQAVAGEFIFAIQWDPTGIGAGHNAFAKFSANVSIQVDAAPNSPSDASAGTFFMGRQWDVDLGPATLDGPVNIKYYYDPIEKSDAEAASAAHALANGLVDNGFSWFKQLGSADFSTITDAAFQPDVYLTTVSTGVENSVDYVQLDGITSFSSGSGGSGSGGGALPVEFISFTGKETGKTNLLNWATASEINSSYYDVETSINGRDFVKIGNVRAAGNSTEVLNYEFVDENPQAVAYYRLKQVDIDGTYEYSNIVNITRTIEGINISLVRPNPTKGATTIQFTNNLEGKVNITLTNVNGQIISTQSLDSVSGMNEVELDLSQVAIGVYFVSISNTSAKAVTRIIKAN